MNTLSKQDYIKALKKLEKSPSDRIGTLGTLGVVVTGASAGALGATGLASAFGISTLLGSTTLASVAGGIFIVSNPVGWALGTATAGAVAAYGISKLVSSGGAQDEKKQTAIKELRNQIANYNKKVKTTTDTNKIGQVAGAFALLLENDLMEEQKVTKILEGVESGEINAEYALSIAQSIIDEASNTSIENQLDISNMTTRSVFVVLYKYMMMLDDTVHQNEITAYQSIMKKDFKLGNDFSLKLLDEAPEISDIDSILKDLLSLVPTEKQDMLLDSLIGIGFSDGEYSDVEKSFVTKVKKILKS